MPCIVLCVYCYYFLRIYFRPCTVLGTGDTDIVTVKKKKKSGVPIVAQWLTNPTRKHEIPGLIPGLAQWVKDPELL